MAPAALATTLGAIGSVAYGRLTSPSYLTLGSGGRTTVGPGGAGPVFETPIAGPVPEELNFP